MGQTAGLDSILRSTLAKIDEQIHAWQNKFERDREKHYIPGTTIYDVVDVNGVPILQPLICARAQVVLAIALNDRPGS